MIAIPKRTVVHGVTIGPCISQVRQIFSQTARVHYMATQTVRIDYMSCCVKSLDICIAQGTDKSIVFVDDVSVDYSLAAKITFDVWENVTTGALLISKSLAAGSIILVNDYTFSTTITNSESQALSRGRKYCEAWVELAGGEQQLVGAGAFEVIDTRKHD